MTNTQDEKQRIEAVIEEWKSAFGALDADRLSAVWDRDYPQPIFIGEEINEALRGSEAISRNYREVLALVVSLDWKIGDLTIDVFGDVAWAYFTYLVKAEVKGFENPMVSDGRNSLILRKSGGQWKIIHFHESLSRDHSHEAWSFLWT